MADQKVVEYVKAALVEGKTREEIYKLLLEQGWSLEVIQGSFNSLQSEKEKEDGQKRTIRIIVTIGAILIAAGIFSFIAANWQGMSKFGKIFIILLSLLSSYAVGWYMKEKANLPRMGGALFLLGSLIYGAGIFLVAQMFNVRANWPDGFLLWMLGTIAMAFALESYGQFYLASILGIIALIGHPFGLVIGPSPRSFLLTSSFLLAISTVVTFATGWIIRKRVSAKQDIY